MSELGRKRTCKLKTWRILQRICLGRAQFLRILSLSSEKRSSIIAFRKYLLESEQLDCLSQEDLISDRPFNDLEISLRICEIKMVSERLDINEEVLVRLKSLNVPNICRSIILALLSRSVSFSEHSFEFNLLWKSYRDLLNGSDEKDDWTSLLGFRSAQAPATDFGGTGVLPLVILLQSAKRNAEWTRGLVARVRKLGGVGFAVLSINLTRWIQELALDKLAIPIDTLFYLNIKENDTISTPSSSSDSLSDPPIKMTENELVCEYVLCSLTWLNCKILDSFVSYWEYVNPPDSVLPYFSVSFDFKARLAKVFEKLELPDYLIFERLDEEIHSRIFQSIFSSNSTT